MGTENIRTDQIVKPWRYFDKFCTQPRWNIIQKAVFLLLEQRTESKMSFDDYEQTKSPRRDLINQNPNWKRQRPRRRSWGKSRKVRYKEKGRGSDGPYWAAEITCYFISLMFRKEWKYKFSLARFGSYLQTELISNYIFTYLIKLYQIFVHI